MKLLKGTKIQALDNQVNIEPSLNPKPPFSLYISAGKGAGKSTTLLNLLLSTDLLAGKFNQIFIICPTNKLDEKWSQLKQTDGTTVINTKLLNQLKKDNKLKSKIFDTNNFDKEYTTSIPEENFIDKVDPQLLKDLIKEQKYVIETYGKNIADKILLVYDDCISSKKFFNSEQVQQLLFNSRHYKISIIITSQNYKSLPKPLRLNNSILCLFYTANKDELKNIYDENSSELGFKTFLEIYNKVCSSKPFNFLTINYQNTIEYRLQSAFEEFVKI